MIDDDFFKFYLTTHLLNCSKYSIVIKGYSSLQSLSRNNPKFDSLLILRNLKMESYKKKHQIRFQGVALPTLSKFGSYRFSGFYFTRENKQFVVQLTTFCVFATWPIKQILIEKFRNPSFIHLNLLSHFLWSTNKKLKTKIPLAEVKR